MNPVNDDSPFNRELAREAEKWRLEDDEKEYPAELQGLGNLPPASGRAILSSSSPVGVFVPEFPINPDVQLEGARILRLLPSGHLPAKDISVKDVRLCPTKHDQFAFDFVLPPCPNVRGKHFVRHKTIPWWELDGQKIVFPNGEILVLAATGPMQPNGKYVLLKTASGATLPDSPGNLMASIVEESLDQATVNRIERVEGGGTEFHQRAVIAGCTLAIVPKR
jgi:hypothetical protein